MSARSPPNLMMKSTVKMRAYCYLQARRELGRSIARCTTSGRSCSSSSTSSPTLTSRPSRRKTSLDLSGCPSARSKSGSRIDERRTVDSSTRAEVRSTAQQQQAECVQFNGSLEQATNRCFNNGHNFTVHSLLNSTAVLIGRYVGLFHQVRPSVPSQLLTREQ